MKFRTDINGLRAYAVVAVMLFHFNKEWVPGGFAGVDVFFVISGYLMTAIIFRGIENDTFSLWRFYSARIRRIIPALLVLVILLMIFGYLFLAPIPYGELAKHSGGSLLFISNFVYWRESGYFDADAVEKFLLHTWSLSVEWQFYILYPIALLILAKIVRLSLVKKILFIGTILSIIAAIFISFKWSVASYFLLPTRMWEMLLGGLVFLYPLRLTSTKVKHSLELVGLLIVILSFFVISEDDIWPGYMALLPTIGAFLLLQANNEKSIFTNNPIAQKLGLWSYSLYLYHWPILVINHKFNLNLNIGVFLLFTLLFAVLSYYLVEIKKWKVSITLIIFAIVLSLTFVVYKTKGASFRVDPKYGLTVQEFHSQYYGGRGYPVYKEARIGKNANSEIQEDLALIFGDSYSWQYARYIDHNQPKVITFFVDGCLMLPDYASTWEFERCAKLSTEFYKNSNKYRNLSVIWAQNWGHGILKDKLTGQSLNKNDNAEYFIEVWTEQIEKSLSLLLEGENTVFLIGKPIVPTYHVPECLSKTQLIGTRILGDTCSLYIDRKEPEINIFLKKIASDYKDVFYIDPSNALCDDKKCKVIIDGEPVFSDMGHLSIYGADIVGKYIFEQIEKIEAEKRKKN